MHEVKKGKRKFQNLKQLMMKLIFGIKMMQLIFMILEKLNQSDSLISNHLLK